MPEPDKPEQDAAEDHHGTENLAHGDQAEEIAKMGVRFAEIFHPDPQQTIADQKEGEDAAMRPASSILPRLAVNHPENHKKHQPFEKGLVEL